MSFPNPIERPDPLNVTDLLRDGLQAAIDAAAPEPKETTADLFAAWISTRLNKGTNE